jgi:competence protein ComGC
MKTSNKLISGLLVAIFVITTLFIITLRNLMKPKDDVNKVNTEWINKE